MKPILWIVSELFYPEESATAFILTNIAQTMKEKYSVKVIAGEPVYETVKDEKQLPEIDIYRVRGSRIDKNNIFQRIKRALFLSKYFADELNKKTSPGDKVLAVTNPAFNILNIAKVCKKKNLNLIILAHDIFPENTISAGLLKANNPIYRILVRKFNKAYGVAKKVIVIGDDMNQIIQKKVDNAHTKVVTIPNWANTSDLKYASYSQKEKIIIKFAGNIGRVQGIGKIIEIINNIHNPFLHFIFQGNGACKELIKNSGLNNVEYLPPYQRREEQIILTECTIGLVTLDSRMFGLGVPSKSYNLMASGRPILFVGPENSEIYNFVRANNIGWAFDINKKEQIISFLNSLSLNDFASFEEKGKKAREIAEEYLSKEIILNRFLEEI